MKIYPDLLEKFPKLLLQYGHSRIMKRSPFLHSHCNTSIKGFGRILSVRFSILSFLYLLGWCANLF